MPRYVILEHDHPSLHWDLMLEAEHGLRTWRLAAPPQLGQTVAATAIFNHRREYLDYEGPVSGNRGQVVRWDHGTFSWLKQEGDHLLIELRGLRLCSSAVLQRIHAEDWTFTVAD
jgi:hypothetical protein